MWVVVFVSFNNVFFLWVVVVKVLSNVFVLQEVKVEMIDVLWQVVVYYGIIFDLICGLGCVCDIVVFWQVVQYFICVLIDYLLFEIGQFFGCDYFIVMYVVSKIIEQMGKDFEFVVMVNILCNWIQGKEEEEEVGV